MAKVPATTDKLSRSKSVSFATRLATDEYNTSSVMPLATLSSVATGLSLAAVTVRVNKPVSVKLPSVTV